MFSAHGGRLFRGARVFVALKIAKAVATMERTIRLQAKLMPRRKIFAILTRTLIFYLLLDTCLKIFCCLDLPSLSLAPSQ